jgi:hypothetical protein
MKLLNVLIIMSLPCASHAQPLQNETKRKPLVYDVKVSPNPTDGPVVIEAPKGSIVTLISIKGTYVGTWEIKGEKLTIEGLPSGNYMARIRNGSMEKTRKFIVL